MAKFNVKVFYAYMFISECKPIYAFYTIMFINRGLSVADVAVLMALWSAFAIIFEIPSGILADRWNRRNLLAIRDILHGCCFIIWFFSHTFPMFAVGFAFWAVAGAFGSGTEEGLLYDNLKSDRCEESFTKVYGKAKLCANMGVVAGIASGGILVGFISIEAIALISAAVCFVNVMVALRIREKNFYSERLDKESISFFNTFKDAGVFLKGSKVALVSVLFLVLFAGIGNYLDEFDALIINDFQLSNIWVSVILSVRCAFVAVGNILAPTVQRKINSVKRIFLLYGISCAVLIVFSVIWNQYAIPIFGLCFMIMAITEILLVNALQSEVKEEGRATVMSFFKVG